MWNNWHFDSDDFNDSLGQEIAREYEVQEAVEESNAINGIWTKKDGTTIKVEDMTTEHICNARNMLKKSNSPIADTWIEVFNKELEKRGTATIKTDTRVKFDNTIVACSCEICGKGTESVHHHICKECRKRLYNALYYNDDANLIKNRVYGGF